MAGNKRNIDWRPNGEFGGGREQQHGGRSGGYFGGRDHSGGGGSGNREFASRDHGGGRSGGGGGYRHNDRSNTRFGGNQQNDFGGGNRGGGFDHAGGVNGGGFDHGGGGGIRMGGFDHGGRSDGRMNSFDRGGGGGFSRSGDFDHKRGGGGFDRNGGGGGFENRTGRNGGQSEHRRQGGSGGGRFRHSEPLQAEDAQIVNPAENNLSAANMPPAGESYGVGVEVGDNTAAGIGRLRQASYTSSGGQDGGGGGVSERISTEHYHSGRSSEHGGRGSNDHYSAGGRKYLGKKNKYKDNTLFENTSRDDSVDVKSALEDVNDLLTLKSNEDSKVRKQMLSDKPYLNFYHNQKGAILMVQEEIEALLAQGESTNAAILAAAGCMIPRFLGLAGEQNALNQFVVGLAASDCGSVAKDTAFLKFANVLLKEKDFIKAAAYYFGASDSKNGVRCLLEHKLYRDAVQIAKIRLDPKDDLYTEVHEAWASKFIKDRCFESGAKCFLSNNDYENAAEALIKRDNALALTTALRAAIIGQLPELESSIGIRCVYSSMVENSWAVGLSAVDLSKSLKPLRFVIYMHQCFMFIGSKGLAGCIDAFPTELKIFNPDIVANLTEKNFLDSVWQLWLDKGLDASRDNLLKLIDILPSLTRTGIFSNLKEMLPAIVNHMTMGLMYATIDPAKSRDCFNTAVQEVSLFTDVAHILEVVISEYDPVAESCDLDPNENGQATEILETMTPDENQPISEFTQKNAEQFQQEVQVYDEEGDEQLKPSEPPLSEFDSVSQTKLAEVSQAQPELEVGQEVAQKLEQQLNSSSREEQENQNESITYADKMPCDVELLTSGDGPVGTAPSAAASANSAAVVHDDDPDVDEDVDDDDD